MCGITGIYNFGTGQPVDGRVLEAMTDLIAHRGPDGFGYHLDREIGLGHRRLAIIDLSEAGAQPMCNEDRSIWIAYNGECYNHASFIPDLKARGHVFRSTTDTEVLLHLYEEHGPDMLNMIRGMYSFAIWDSNRKRILLARDRLGIKPLYYHTNGKRLLFASEMKSFMAVPDFERRLNYGALAEFFRCRSVMGSERILSGVKHLDPGHYLVADSGGVRVARYWDVSDMEQRTDLDLETAAHEFRERFGATVNSHLMSDVPVAAFLSGGVDSGAVTAMAASGNCPGISTFSVSFTGYSQYDESDYAEQVARKYGTDHHKLEAVPDLVSNLEDMVWHSDEPFSIPSALPLFLLSRLASEQVKVVLTGDGSDEIFAGYPYRHDVGNGSLHGVLGGPFRSLLGIFGSPSEYASGRGPFGRVGQWLAHKSRSKGGTYSDSLAYIRPHELGSILSPEYLRTVMPALDDDLIAQEYANCSGGSDQSRRLYADLKSTLVSEMLTKVDRMTMASSLEARVPFLDHEMVEWAFTLPDKCRLENGQGKRVVKKAMEPLLPHDLLYRPKHGFNVPLADWFRGDLCEWVRDVLSSESVRKRGIFRPESVESTLAEHMSGADHAYRIFTMITLETWYRLFMDVPTGGRGVHVA